MCCLYFDCRESEKLSIDSPFFESERWTAKLSKAPIEPDEGKWHYLAT